MAVIAVTPARQPFAPVPVAPVGPVVPDVPIAPVEPVGPVGPIDPPERRPEDASEEVMATATTPLVKLDTRARTR